ncbi:hypothetical protein ACFRAE_03525 [Sphingobacterium sp. HJSM2_6]|uniref:hypothetical protein n=1 Tax=Sphingobacterium sp. HJSM2_6 TaxID=3366264 RepID=UPI003BD5C0B8
MLNIIRFNFGLFLLALGTYSCQSIPAREQEVNGKEATFKLEPGWDIYDGGGYRYGPSIIIDKDGTIHAWFASPGGIHGVDHLQYQEFVKESPIPVRDQTRVAQKFTNESDFYAIAAICPNWNSKNSSLTLSLYQWNTDYEKTIQGPVISSQRFENYADNSILKLTNEQKFKAGTYLWVIHEGVGSAGVWALAGETNQVSSYLDGKIQTHNYKSFVMNDVSNAAVYWDQVAYKKSTDQGKTWSDEKMVLKPTEGTRDEFSICDPGVVKYGKYYYLGYTSTEDIRMIFNHVYVARSLSPEGPWEKWDGKGWGNAPQPVVTFDGNKDAWGAGEPSMVIKNDSLYFYYTWRDKSKHEVRVAVADAKDENWPRNLQQKGIALDQNNIDKGDHADVKYRPDLNKFYMLHTASRLSPESHLLLWESNDGYHFKQVSKISELAEQYLHNCGWSADEMGHIDPNKQQFLAYGYGKDWGNWKTKWHPISFDSEKLNK